MPDPRPPLPVRSAPAPAPALDRAAMERVLARAAELQVARAGADDGLSEDDLLAAAREAGLAPDHVRLAIAEERLRAARVTGATGRVPAGGLAAWAAGPGHVGAERVVAGSAAAALDAFGAWLEREEGMRLARRVGEQAAWEPRRDVLGNLARGLRGGGSRALRRAALVSAVALPAGEGRVLVRVEADVTGARRQRLAAGVVAAGGGVAAGGSILGLGVVAHALLAVVAPVAVIPVLAGGAAAWALTRGQREAVARTQAALEQLLDQVETRLAAGPPSAAPRPATATGLLDMIDGVRRALR